MNTENSLIIWCHLVGFQIFKTRGFVAHSIAWGLWAIKLAAAKKVMNYLKMLISCPFPLAYFFFFASY